MKHLLLFFNCTLWLAITAHGQTNTTILRGVVTSETDGQPLPGVNVIIKGTPNGVITDYNGEYSLSCPDQSTISFSYIGYETITIERNGRTTLHIQLKENIELLSGVEIYSTGYQEIPLDRATGSFEHIDQELIQRSTGTDIISRLENVTSGLQFDKRLAGDTYGDTYRNLRIRGISGIDSDNSPLIVVDNFPYEGDINSINPNTIDHITVLKDAAAASIWGARAANGVIVITTKKGQTNQPMKISLNSNITWVQQPDFHYTPDFLPSKDFIEVEQTLFDRGYYDSKANSYRQYPLSPAVELLLSHRDGSLSDQELDAQLYNLSQFDVRDQAEKYFYRPAIYQQYALSLQGGTSKHTYFIAGGYDHNALSIDGNNKERFTLNVNNSIRPIEALNVAAAININHNQQTSNGLRWGNIETKYPYNHFVDDQGNWSSVVNDIRLTYAALATEEGLLDWSYRPMQEKHFNDVSGQNTEYRIDLNTDYSFTTELSVGIKYQYQQIQGTDEQILDKDSYAVRSRVNRYTQADGSRVFPYGAIRSNEFSQQAAQALRSQISYNKRIAKHRITALAGAEARNIKQTQQGLQVYGYDEETLIFSTDLDYTTRYPLRPAGSLWITPPANYFGETLDRYISYFANTSYMLKDTYGLSASVRWDASNLFGVKTNQKGVPLWSAGASWNISNETFYNVNWLPYLRLRTTYGYNGNINKSLTAYPTASYTVDNITNLSKAILRSPGNPQLRWERVSMVNVGVDFETNDQRVAGSFEYYDKFGTDMIADTPIDPTTGFLDPYKTNFAETRTSGFDIQIHTRNTINDWKLSTDILCSYTSNKIRKAYPDAITSSSLISRLTLNTAIIPIDGNSIDGIYSLPWVGLNPDNGNPQVIIEGQQSEEYRDYIQNLQLEDLIYNGPSVAPIFGAIRNNLSWKNIGISFNVSWKSGYYFRRSGINYYDLFESAAGHKEYVNRWQNPGDEAHTQVPSMPEIVDFNRDLIYNASEILVEPGDHIRLEDINLSYALTQLNTPKLPFSELRVFCYARNLGILWQASKSGLDPDYPNASYRSPRSYSIGLNATF